MAATVTATLVATLAAASVVGYNVDVHQPTVYRGPADTMFGFSVAGYTDRDSSWVLVGAPRAQTPQPGVVEGGAVYRCGVNTTAGAREWHSDCQQIPFDTNGNNVAGGRAIDEKSGQWFGAMVTSTPGRDNTGVVVACAPRYMWFSSNQRRREPVGTCYVAKNGFSDIQEYAVCRTGAWGYHRQGSCQSGLGSAINKVGDRLFVGAVGSWYWQGQLYSLSIAERSRPLPPLRFFQSSRLGQLFSQHLFTRPDLAGTSEGPSSEDDSYLGYSVAVGEFNGDTSEDVVVGMPRGANLTGKVVLYDSRLQNLFNITGEQIGAYFGHSICVCDVNGDKLDDVIIGAPFYTHFANTEGKYETGRVVIAYQNSKHDFKQFGFLEGKQSKSRFGMALASLGDIDWDGYDDIAVGAPHDGTGDEGAVYIFHGTKNGVSPEPTQVILASKLEANLRSFGFSVSGGLDLDGNQYPDLVIGAHDSSAAVYLRSRPVVHVESSAQYLSTGASKLLELGNEQLRCLLRDGRRATCVTVRFCLNYDGLGADKRAEFQVQFRLDARRPKTPRMFFRDRVNVSRANFTARAVRGQQWCTSQAVYVEETVRDKLSPLVTEVHYSLVTRKPDRQLATLWPVLNLDRPPVASDTISIQKNCGRDGVCVPDLQMTARPDHATYLLGSRERLTLDVTVFNAREDAFEALFYLDLPKGVDYVATEKAESSSSQPALCTLKELDRDLLVCDLGNPLPASSEVHLHVHLMPHGTSEDMQRHYQFTLAVNSTNAEEPSTGGDNQLSLTLPIRIHTELAVSGISLPETVHYNRSEYSAIEKTHEHHIGPEVFHVYELTNRGPSDIVAAEAYIMWPTYTLPQDKHLLYLLEEPLVEGPGYCDPVPDLNPLQLQLDSSAPLPAATPVAPPYRQRRRRQSESEFQAALGCGPTVCTKIVCRLGPLSHSQNVIIRIRTRVWVDTIEDEIKDGKLREVIISSKLAARVTELPYMVDPSYMNHTTHAVTSRIQCDDGSSAPVPWWVIVLASCGGVLILLLMILILYKLGFFKRRRRPEARGANGAGNGHSHVPGTNGHSNGARSGGTNGRSTLYGFHNVPYAQPGDEAL